MTDHRALLVKYMAHVADFEGTTYVREDWQHDGRIKFTDEEHAELLVLSRESERVR